VDTLSALKKIQTDCIHFSKKKHIHNIAFVPLLIKTKIMYDINNFKNNTKYLLFSGGGSRGVSILSFLNYLFRHYEKTFNRSISVWLKHKLKGCAGTSVGSIIAFTLCCRIDPYYILQKIHDNMHMFNVSTYSKSKGIYKRSLLENIATTNYRYTNQISIEYLYDLVRTVMDSWCGIHHRITMRDFYETTKIELVINTFDIVSMKEIILDHKNTPDLRVIDAIVCSCCIPTIFEPCGIQYKENYWVLIDGGYRNNMMVSPFDPSQTMSICLNSHIFNRHDVVCPGFCPSKNFGTVDACEQKDRGTYRLFHIKNPFTSYYQYSYFVLSEHFYYYKDLHYLNMIPRVQLEQTVFLTNFSKIECDKPKSYRWIQNIKNVFDVLNIYDSMLKITKKEYSEYISDGAIHFYLWMIGVENLMFLLFYYSIVKTKKQ